MSIKIISIYTPNIRVERFLQSYKKHVTNAELCIKEVKSYPGHIDKFFMFDNIEDEQWYLFTDVYDVYFQKDLPDLDKFGCDILVSSEGEKWSVNSYYRGLFKKYDFLNDILDMEVHCSGTFAMKGKHLIDMIDFFKLVKEDYKEKLNQPIFNLWLFMQEYKNCNELFCTLHANIDKGIVIKKDGIFYNHGIISSMVHGNGSYDKYL